MVKVRVTFKDPDTVSDAVKEAVAASRPDGLYADLAAARVGGDLGEAVRAKFNKVSEKRGSSVRL